MRSRGIETERETGQVRKCARERGEGSGDAVVINRETLEIGKQEMKENQMCSHQRRSGEEFSLPNMTKYTLKR